MGYWSIMQSVDYMDEHSDFVVPMSPDETWKVLAQTVPRPGRVVCFPDADGIDVQTVNHTPAWALPYYVLGLILTFFVRKTRHARLTVSPAPEGAVIHVRGKLDTKAATAIRNLRAA